MPKYERSRQLFRQNDNSVQRLAVRVSSAAAVALCCGTSFAQPGEQASPAGAPIEEVVVTGSFIGRRVDSPTPVSVITAEELDFTPRTSVGEFFHADPSFTGSEVYTSFGTGLGSSVSASVNLRGLGPRATLVLLNGRRSVYNTQPTRDGVLTFDINSLIPAIAIQRVEILKDGASALYGTDAIAGVVNFITRDNFDGFEIEGSWQTTDTGGQDEALISGLFGIGNEATRLIAAVEYLDRGEFNFLDFPDVAAFSAEHGARSSIGSPGSFRLIPGETYNATVPPGAPNRLIRDPLCGDPRLGEGTRAGIPGFLGPAANDNQVCLTDNNLGRGAIAAVERLNAFSKATYSLTDTTNVGLEVGFSRASFARAGGYGYNQPELLVPAEHPANPFGGDVLFRGRVQGPAAGRGNEQISNVDNRTWRVALVADGELSENWRWDASYTWSKHSSFATRLDAVRERMENALRGLGGLRCDPETGTPGTGECLYFNPFGSQYVASPGDPEHNDPELMAFIRPEAQNIADGQLITYTGVISGDLVELPGGPLGVAFGYEHREETMDNDYDPITLGGGFSFVAVEVPFHATRDIDAAFVETVIPASEEVEIQIAGRYEDYGGGVDKFVPKLGVLWTPTPALFVRATAGKAFRAPDLLPSFGTNAGVVEAINVPGILGTNPLAITTPNPELQPEETDVLTAGFTWDATDTVTVRADWWQFDFSNIIGQESAQLVLEEYLATGAHADRLFFDASNVLTEIHLQFDNFSSLQAQGIDFGMDWTFAPGPAGELALAAYATWTNEYDYQIRDDQPVVDGLGRVNNGAGMVSPMPEWKANLSLSYARGEHYARATLRFIDGILSDSLPDDDPRQSDSDYYQFDVFYGRSFDFQGAPLELRLAVNNVFDERPPLLTGVQPAIPGVYDIHGRTYSIGFSKSF